LRQIIVHKLPNVRLVFDDEDLIGAITHFD
jgi:hypothetical protein